MFCYKCVDCNQISSEEYMWWTMDLFNGKLIWRCADCHNIASASAARYNQNI